MIVCFVCAKIALIYLNQKGLVYMTKISLKAVAYHTIKEKIVTRTFLPGSFLSEEKLTEDLKISRTPVREALIRLEQEGLVEIRPKVGIMVTPLTMKSINMIFEIRCLFEPYILKQYGPSIPDEELTKFLQIFSRPNDLGNESYERYYSLDAAFHNMILEACPNTFIKNTYAQIQTQSDRFRYMTGNICNHRLEDTFKEHADILKACLIKDWDTAVDKLLYHLEQSKKATFDLAMDSLITI